MRAPHSLPVLLLMLAAGCGGSSSGSGSPTTTAPTSLSLAQQQQLMHYTKVLSGELTAHPAPDTFVAPSRQGGGLPAFARDFALAATAAALPAGAVILTPCTGITSTTGPDANGYTTATTDFGTCTDGTSGKVVTRWKQTTSTFDLSVTFTAFTTNAALGSVAVVEAIDGSVTLSSSRSGSVWTSHYTVPTLAVTDTTSPGGAPVLQYTHSADLTTTFTLTSASGQPTIGDFSVYGYSRWSSINGLFKATIDPATPLLWKDLGSGTACRYPISGRIGYDVNGYLTSITFSSNCGYVTLGDGTHWHLDYY